MQTVADMRGVGVKNSGKSVDVLCRWPPTPMPDDNNRKKKLQHARKFLVKCRKLQGRSTYTN